MTERRAPGLRPTFDDYCAMMHGMHASDQLKEDVLDAARARHVSADEHFAVARPSVRSAPAFKRARTKPFAVAACVVLLAGTAAAFALGVPGVVPSIVEGDNSFSLAAYAAEGSGAQPGTAVVLNADEFKGTGGYSGAWYNPDTGQFAAYDEWAGFKYSFNMQCSGRNIKKVAYEIEGDRAYFETIDGPSRTSKADHTSSFHYSKSVAFDYDDQSHGFGNFSDNQQAGRDDYVVSIYLGFPVPEPVRSIGDEIIAGTAADSAFYEKSALIDLEAARTLEKCRLHLTATFDDGSTQTKTYTITPVADVEQRLSDFWNASYHAQAIDRQHEGDGKESFTPALRPEPPALFALTETSST